MPLFALLLSTVTITVNTQQTLGPFKPISAYFGYDEPNYTYTANGQKLVGELAALSPHAPVFIRTHFMLATGDGTPGLKWGSTNAFTLDGAGKPVYDWTITDRVFDTYRKAGAKPFAEIGFMPQALSSRPEPYHPTWIPGEANKDYAIGWSYPPKDYGQWGELVYQWVRHCVEKYGPQEVATWYWEVWNEPDISYWHGTPEEYNRLYDFAAAAVKRALPTAKIGGPATTGPASPKAAAFLRQFLEHCAQTHAPLDFISYHAKGRPTVVDGHVRMGIAKNAADVDEGFKIVRSFPQFQDLPIVLTESDPEGCAACSARVYPQNAYRNGPLYAAYTAAMFKAIHELAASRHANIEGMLTWAFEFENQPYFDGFRTLATNGIDKPILNFFRMAGMLRGERVPAASSAAIASDALLANGVTDNPDVDAFAVRSSRGLSVLVFHYHDDDLPGSAAQVHLAIQGLPKRGVRVRHYRIDQDHSNAWTAWKKMGSPQHPSAEQYAALEAASRLQEVSVQKLKGGALDFSLPRNAVSLLQFAW